MGMLPVGVVELLAQFPLDTDHHDEVVQFRSLGRAYRFQGVVSHKRVTTPAFDNIVEDSLLLVVIRP